jgi:hypothetical protein
MLCTLLSCLTLAVAPLQDKVLICGIGKNVESAVPNTIASITALGAHFSDYRVVIYENNSKDKTKKRFQAWAKDNPKVIFFSEKLKKSPTLDRTEKIARARNKVLDEIMKVAYEDYKYVIWVDLDFLDPWDVEHIVETIANPEQEWDAVFANGSYDLFAFRDEEFPIGSELIGTDYWGYTSRLCIKLQDHWKKVYSAFGGLGIYKRESLKGSRYSGVVTQDLENQVARWLECARSSKQGALLEEYEAKLKSKPLVELSTDQFVTREWFASEFGLKMNNSYGLGQVVWFSCNKDRSLPIVCEHLPLHASMAERGHNRLFINPKLLVHHP